MQTTNIVFLEVFGSIGSIMKLQIWYSLVLNDLTESVSSLG